LAGEAGLRAGEVKALRWREDVDLIAGTITVNEQTCHGITGTPKGGRRRKVPMTATLIAALKQLDVVRTGYVIRNLDGSQKTDGETTHAIRRICRRARLPETGWHRLRHTFGTHAALLGMNPFKLQAYLGHSRMEETMLYVHVAQAHARPIPPELLLAADGELDPDRRVIKMLGARVNVRPTPVVVAPAGEAVAMS
jgi:integrase